MYIAIIFSLFFISFAFPACGVNSTTATLENSNNNKNVTSQNATDSLLAPTAEKLIRYRRQPPFSIVKHVTRSTKRSNKRRRTKAPRIKYGPPNHSAGEPLSYYSPHFSSHSSADVPSFSFDNFQHLSFDAADLKIPPSSYEAQTMDLEFYHHDSPKTYEATNIGYTFGEEHEQPLYSYEDSTALREPHQKYGVPHQNDYSTGYNSISDSDNHQLNANPISIGPYESPDSFVSHNYQPPSPVDYSSNQHQSFEPPAPQHTVDTQYGAPTLHGPPLSTLHSLPSPTHQNNFGVYDKKIPNVGYHQTQQNFAEPPPTQHSSNSNFDITFSHPTYEISSTSNDVQQTGNHFLQYYPPHSNSENFGPPSSSHPQQPHDTHSQQPKHTHPHPQQDYSLPTQELPLNPHHKFPTYDYPKSSYEVPIYDPVPFETSHNEERESYPPEQEGKTDVPPTHEVSVINQNNHEEQFYNTEQINPSPDEFDTHTSGSAKTTTRGQTSHQQRKRKRIRGRGSTPTPSSKHILDVPELQKAFESTNQNIHRERVNDPDTNESHYIEDKRTYKKPTISTTPPTLIGVHTSETFINHDWSPMRTQTSSTITSFRPTITPTKSTTKSTVNSDRYRQRLAQRSRNRPTTSTPSTESYKANTKYVTPNHNSKTRNRDKSSTVSIEKSHSKSFYDGTVAPPSNHYQMPTFPSRHNEALALNPNLEDANSSQQSTKSVFDTTHFKSPNNDKGVQRQLESLLKQNLPKNHKLF